MSRKRKKITLETKIAFGALIVSGSQLILDIIKMFL